MPGHGIEQSLFREQRFRRLKDLLQALGKERTVLHLYGIVPSFQQWYEQQAPLAQGLRSHEMTLRLGRIATQGGSKASIVHRLEEVRKSVQIAFIEFQETRQRRLQQG